MVQKHLISAHYLAKSLPLGLIEKRNELALMTKRRNALIFGRPQGQMMFVFSYGVVVLYGFDEKRAAKVLDQIAKYGEEPVEFRKKEEYAITIDPAGKISVEFEHVVIDDPDPDLVYVIAEVLAQSVAIDYVEEKVNGIMRRFGNVTEGLEKGGRIRVRNSEVLKTIGAGRSITQYVIAQMSLLDKPDSTWEDRDVETAFVGMRKMFELEDRFKALEFRLNFIQDTTELVLDVLQNRKSNMLEWAIIYLFIIDLVLVGYEMLNK
jgi:uncharacterized Rmd1/YagE family protein